MPFSFSDKEKKSRKREESFEHSLLCGSTFLTKKKSIRMYVALSFSEEEPFSSLSTVITLLSVETFHVRIYFYRVPPVSFSTVEARGKLDAGWSVQPILEIVFSFINHGG